MSFASVNVSPIEFAQESFVDGLIETLEETCLPPRILDIEVTERVFLQATRHGEPKAKSRSPR